MKRSISVLLIVGITTISVFAILLKNTSPIFAHEDQKYDCSNPYFNDKRLTECTDCGQRCSGSISYNSCIYWCEGNNYCKGCDSNSDNNQDESIADDQVDTDSQTFVIIQSIKGDVQVSFQDTEYTDAKVGMKLEPGDYISTGFESEAVIQIQNVGFATVHEMTILQFHSLLLRMI